MSKKTHPKKKINIKLENNQSFIVEDLSAFLHIQKTYTHFLRGHVSNEDKVLFTKIINSVDKAIANLYTAPVNGDDYYGQ